MGFPTETPAIVLNHCLGLILLGIAAGVCLGFVLGLLIWGVP